MQLDGQKTMRSAVTAIAATLLGSGAVAASGSGNMDSSLLIYSETGRVKVAEGVIDFGRQLSEQRSVGLRLTLDALTGASPNGATPSSHIQTFTSPSGGSSYVVDLGQLPLDNTFSDKRIALDARLQEALDRLTYLNVGGHLSLERDYTSIGVNGRLGRDFNRRNTSLGVAAAYAHDIVSPIGGAPVPLASMPPPSESAGEGEEDEEGGQAGPGRGKDNLDFIIGLTQVLDRNTILRLDYSLSWSRGYLNDPYKLLSVVYDRNSAMPGEPANYVYEARPNSRYRQAFFAEVRRYIGGNVLNLSYRYFWDDWGVKSHTGDVFVRLPVPGNHAIEPHFRWYRQSQADFYATYLIEGQRLPTYASADSRLAAFDAITLGLKYSIPVGAVSSVNLTGEYYTQLGERGPPDAFGILSQYDLFPALDVFMVRVGYSHGF
jgi:hypothetical protein